VITNTGSVGIGTTSVQTGAQLTVQNATASGTTYGVYISDATTGAGYGVYGTITGHGNTGYFSNTDTSSNSNYGVYATVASGGGYSTAVQGTNSASSDGNGVGGSCTAGSNTCGAVVGVNSGTSGQGSGGFFTTSQAAAAAGVQGSETGAANTGYGGYFSNTGTGAINYGIYASVASTTGWAGYFNGNIYLNGTITLSSDRRMKRDIEPLDTADALDEITALRPVAFTWKKTGAPDMGLIAQEVDLVYPDLVTHSGANETLALKYTSLIAPMIASIQELKKRDDELEIENAALRRDFNAYKETHP
jgi:trimeric autotransporter adhesin